MPPPATDFQRRILVGVALCVLAFSVVALRLVDVAVLRGGAEAQKPAAPVRTARTDLVDRNGELLARELPADDLYLRPALLGDRRRAARELAVATGGDEQRLYRLLASRHRVVLAAQRLTGDVRARIALLKLPGLEYVPSGKRYYPDGRMTAQVVGVTDPDGKGVSGLELGLDKRLRAGAGPVATSLDMRVQFVVAHEAEASMEEFHARAAGGLVMDVHTGEILALVSLPDFDPNARDFVGDVAGRNLMAQDVYELGSVFKIFSFAMAIENNTVRLDEALPIGKGFKIGRYTIHEAEAMPATLTARDVLAQSSNIGTAQIVLRSGPERQRAFLARLGLLSAVRSELPERARPLYPDHWGMVETATIGFGHGISVSPLAFAAAAAAVVNGGRRITPTFLRRGGDGRGEQLISPQTSEIMRTLLRYVVTDGTGKKADVAGYDVGGKTGSAEKPGPHGYQHNKLVTSFFAAFPISDPRYIVFVVLDEPHGNKSTAGFALAGYTAAPLAGHVIARIAPLLGVPMAPITLARGNT